MTIDELPRECVEDCSATGSVDHAVEYWCNRLQFTVDREAAIRCLKGYGAWDDLAETDDETLAQRVLWLACNDFNEFITYCEREGLNPYLAEAFSTPAGSDIFVLE